MEYRYLGQNRIVDNHDAGWSDPDEDMVDSDDGPLLHKRNRYAYEEGGERRRSRKYGLGTVFKWSLICTAMILFCLFMYLPMYSKVFKEVPKDLVAGWPLHANRDTRVYVQPENVTIIHEVKNFCSLRGKEKLFLLIVVCSATNHFERRKAIRESWADYRYYRKFTQLFAKVHEKYKHSNWSDVLYPEGSQVNLDVTAESKKVKREAGFNNMLASFAEILKKSPHNTKNSILKSDYNIPEFDMNKEFNDVQPTQHFDYDYDTNVMKIPPNGFEEPPDIDKVLSVLRLKNLSEEPEIPEVVEEKDTEEVPDYKLLFLLGTPTGENSTVLQQDIDKEAETYNDIIQENFIDSYNNLTLKSIMMLKWVVSNCNNVRYILKTDDDSFVNVVNLVSVLKTKAKQHDVTSTNPEYLLMGYLICGAKPVLDPRSKFFTPRYMYPGRVFPRYLSGSGYVFSGVTAGVLYKAALTTPYLHMEDVYITGICAQNARPRVRPLAVGKFNNQGKTVCHAFEHNVLHRMKSDRMKELISELEESDALEKCERARLTKISHQKKPIIEKDCKWNYE